MAMYAFIISPTGNCGKIHINAACDKYKIFSAVIMCAKTKINLEKSHFFKEKNNYLKIDENIC